MPRPISEATRALRAKVQAILDGIDAAAQVAAEPMPASMPTPTTEPIPASMPASANPNLSVMREAVDRGRREGWLSRLWVDEDGCIRVEDAEEEL
jgi:hypothetical protein